MVDVAERVLYEGIIHEIFHGEEMQLIRKFVNLELECIQHQRFFDLYCGSRRPRYKRKNSKKKTFKRG